MKTYDIFASKGFFDMRYPTEKVPQPGEAKNEGLTMIFVFFHFFRGEGGFLWGAGVFLK